MGCATSHDSFKALLVSWENCSQVDLLAAHWFPYKAGQLASNRHHQTIGKRLGGGNKHDALYLGDLSCAFAPGQ